MKKRIFLLFLCILALTVSMLLFSACNDEEPNTGGETGNNATSGDSSSSGDSSGGNSSGGSASDSGSSSEGTSDSGSSGGNASSDKESGTTDEAVTVKSSSGLAYSLNSDGNSYIVTDMGNCTDSVLVIPDMYNGKTVTGIGDLAFYNCTELTSVTIGNFITSIGEGAFERCTELTSITVGNNVTRIGSSAFKNCEKLATINFNAKICSVIGDNAFLNSCTGESGVSLIFGERVKEVPSELLLYLYLNIEKLTIGSGVTTFDSTALEHCTNITEINVSSKNTVYKSVDGNLYSKDGKTLIKYAARKNATSFVIPSGVTEIGAYAFCGSASLMSITVPESVTNIGEFAFKDCYKLVEVINKSSSLTITKGEWDNGQIGQYALEVHNGDSRIKEDNGYIFYPYDGTNYLISYIGNGTRLTLPKDCDGEGYEIYKEAFVNNKNIVSVTIPDSVTGIGNSAFMLCTSLTSVTFGSGVTSIVNYAFYQCSALTSVTIPEGVTSIGVCAFYQCTALTSVTIPKSITSIGNFAFSDCENLTTVNYRGTEAEWNEISTGRSWDSDTGSYTINYSYK